VTRPHVAGTRSRAGAPPTHWTRQVFVDHAATYAEILRSAIPKARPEVEGVRQILGRAGIAPGSRLLDFACGIGRHAVPLAAAGYGVVGCDLSPVFIREARDRARRELLPTSRARFFVADYRTVRRRLRRIDHVPFDGALCLFTSMGFQGRRSDRAVLASIRALVRPGGLLIFETGDRDAILRRFRDVDVRRYPTDLEVHERRSFDRERSTMHSVWTFYRRRPRGHLRRLFETEISVRLYALHELYDLFEDAGWKIRHSFGDLASLPPVSSDSTRLVIVAERPRSLGRRSRGPR
jgi:SAM-dependent methyltransferase